VLFRLAPGSAVTDLSRVPHATKATRLAIAREFGLDKSKWDQYVIYLKQLAHFNLGVSYQNSQPVWSNLKTDLANTIPMVTLGTLYIVRGLDSMWIGPRQIVAHDLPGGYVRLGHGGPFLLPYLAVIALAVLLVLGFHLRSYRGGRELYAIGSHPEAARLAGVSIRKRVTAAYVVCGALAGLGGALYLARFGNVDSGTGGGYELTVVSAVVVGGVAFTGGSGSVFGAALGALLLTTINSALPSLGVASSWEGAIDGFLLLAAIAVDRLVALRVAAVLRRRNVRHG